jgi:hypothetical protein
LRTTRCLTLLLAFAAGSVAPAAARAEPQQLTPATGVDEKPRRGTFVETTLGFFTAMGGSRPFSNGQPYLGIQAGREIGEQGSVFIALGIGAVSASCYQVLNANGDCAGADSFGATFAEIGGAYGVAAMPRLLLSVKLVGGITNLSPGPVRDGSSVPDNLFGFHIGGGGALDYDTHLDHFAVGIDALIRYSLVHYTPQGGAGQTLGLPTLSVMPRIRYVF